MRSPAGWLPTCVGHHWLDLARAYRRMGKPEQALDALQAARRVDSG
jgi:cytochrome c-type biogenesis protein CcmH/NrfG